MASIESSSGDDDGGEVAPGGLLGVTVNATMNAVSGAVGYFTGSKQDGGKEVGPDTETWEHLSIDSLDGGNHRGVNQPLSPQQYQHEFKARDEEIKELKEKLMQCDKHQKELGEFVSKLNKGKEHLAKEVATKDGKMASMRQELRQYELKSMAEVARLKEQLATASGDSSSADSAMEHTKKQAKIIYDLRQKIEMLKLEVGDGDSFRDLLREAEDERDKLREDFCSAREEIDTLKEKLVDLGNELQSSKMETLRLSTGDCNNQQCKTTRAEFRKMINDIEAEKSKVARFRTAMEEMKRRNAELEHAKNEAVGEIAVVRAESDIYKSDFLEEREDRERAQGALDALKKEMGGQDTVFQEELTRNAKTISGLKQERNNLKKEFARVEAKYREENETSKAKFTRAEAKLQKEISASKTTIGVLKSKVEEISSERDDLKAGAQYKKKGKGDKSKELAKLKAQLKHSTETTVKMTDQVDHSRQEKKEMQKALSKAEAKIRKLEKPPNKRASSVLQTHEIESETLYEQERDRNQKLEEEIDSLRDDIQHHKSVIVTLKSLISAEQNESASPGDTEKTLPVSPTTDHNKNSLQFQNDPSFIASSEDTGPVAAVQQNAPSRNPGEAGTGQYQNVSLNQQPGSLPKAPVNQVLERGSEAGNTRQGRRGAQDRSKSAGDLLDEQSKPDHDQQRRPPTLPMTQGRHPQDSAPQNKGTQQFSKERHTQGNIPPQGSRDYPPQGNNDYPLHSPQGYPPQNLPREYPKSAPQGHPQQGYHAGENRDYPPQGRDPQHGYHAEEKRDYPPQGRDPQQGYHAEEKRDYTPQGNRAYPPQGRDSQQEYYGENRGRGVHSADIPMKNSNNRGMYPPEHGHDQRHSEPIRAAGPYPSGGEMARGRQDRPPQQQPGYGRQAKSQPQPQHYDQYGAQPQGRQGRSGPKSAELPYQHQHPFRAGSQGDIDPQHPMSAASGRQPPPHGVELQRPASHPIASKPGGGGGGHHVNPPTTSIDTQTSLDFSKGAVQQPGVSLATQTSIQGQPASNRGPGGKKRDVTASSTENVLVKGIDNEIEAMAAVVQDEVSQDNKYKETQDLTPLDSNLVCPMCGKEHRIGEIQKFKIHVDQCGGKGTLI